MNASDCFKKFLKGGAGCCIWGVLASDPGALRVFNWLGGQQLEDGSFESSNPVFLRDTLACSADGRLNGLDPELKIEGARLIHVPS